MTLVYLGMGIGVLVSVVIWIDCVLGCRLPRVLDPVLLTVGWTAVAAIGLGVVLAAAE